MKKPLIYIVWGALYCLCVGFGFIPNPQGLGKALLVAVSLLFFVPPFYLLWLAKKESSCKTVTALRLLSICVLALSLILLVLNFLSVNFSAETGRFLFVALVMFSAPMVTSQYWALSLFLWAVLMMLTMPKKSANKGE